ncbi:hypothetical protein CBS101457_002167 [Exobasidium rhododendri]|nr:hypothetical protein CBS101457_002167 [Exobasidium rhododendri]
MSANPSTSEAPSSSRQEQDDAEEQSAERARSKPPTPVPWKQLIVVLLMRLAEPISFSLIFPFIGDMLWDLGATDNRGDIGMYAGIVESIFAAVQTVTVLQWGRASDKFGRKPILINGLIGASISTILLGLSTSLPMLILARSLSGALNGNVAIFKSVVGEMTDRTNAARAFSFLPLIWALGVTVGPLLGEGGYLSQPSKKYPFLFSTREDGLLALNGLWERYPYFLPCVVSATITWCSIMLGIFFLEETLPSKVVQTPSSVGGKKKATEQTALLSASNHARSYDSTAPRPASIATANTQHSTDAPLNREPSRSFHQPSRKRSRMSLGRVQSWTSGFTPTQSRDASPALEQTSPLSSEGEGDDSGIIGLLKIAHIRDIMLSYAFLSLTSVALDSVQVLYFWEPITLGGLSFPSTITGTFLSVSGVFGVLLQLTAFPYLQRRVGTLRLYTVCLSAFLFVPLIMPLANLAARKGLKGEEHEDGFETDVEPAFKVLVFVLVASAMAMKTIAVMAFSCNIILVNQATALAPGAQLGTLNGLAQMSSSLMRAVGPYAASSLFAVSLTKHLVGGYLIWIILFIIGLGGVVVTSTLADVEKMIDRGEIDEDAANPRG